MSGPLRRDLAHLPKRVMDHRHHYGGLRPVEPEPAGVHWAPGHCYPEARSQSCAYVLMALVSWLTLPKW